MLLEESEYGESWTVTQLMTFFLCLETVLEGDRANQKREVRHASGSGRPAGRGKSPSSCRAGDEAEQRAGRGHTQGGRAHKCHLSHEDVREGRSRAHGRFWKLRVRCFEWPWALAGAAT